jgi:pyruvate formate lyase activating enzyme
MEIPEGSRRAVLAEAATARQACSSAADRGADPPHPAAASPSGLVTNIQRFSTQDGPGIRTTVFLKGCSNACAWCHNPESIRPTAQLQFAADRCLGCGRCVAACPHGVHALDQGVHRLRREDCLACGRCVAECFAGALGLAGKRLDPAQVLQQVLADLPYYRRSGGGVTFSGGEPLLQRAFLRQLLADCRAHGVSTAIETAGNYPWEWLASVLELVDLVMYDLKVLDPARHERYIGNDGRRSLANLQRLAATGKPLIVRTPVVCGVNDAPEQIEPMARLVAGFAALQYYELLPYHALGEAKRPGLGLPPGVRFGTPPPQALADLARVARTHVPLVRP